MLTMKTESSILNLCKPLLTSQDQIACLYYAVFKVDFTGDKTHEASAKNVLMFCFDFSDILKEK